MRRIASSTLGRACSIALTVTMALGPAAQALPAHAQTATRTSVSPSVSESVSAAREIVSRRTEYSRQFKLPSGVIRAEYFADPIHYRDEKTGRLLRIDSRLESETVAGDRVATNKANDFEVLLPEDLGEDAVRIILDDTSLAMRPAASNAKAAAELPETAPRSERKSATEVAYPEAFGGAELTYESRSDGLKETIVVSEPTSATAFAFDLELSGLIPRPERDGSVSLVPSGQDRPSARIAKPLMWDSAQGPNGPAYSEGVRYEISGAAPSLKLTVIADAGWLSDPARVYPVFIDPTVETRTGAPLDTYVTSRSGYQNTNYSSSTLMYTNRNYPSANWVEYALVQPGQVLTNDLAEAAEFGYEVVSARMQMYVGSVSAGGTVRGSRCTSPVTISSVTWSSKPSVVASYTSSETNASVGNANTFDATEIVKYWQDAEAGPTDATIQFEILESGKRVAYKTVEHTQDPVWSVDFAPVPVVEMTSPSDEVTGCIYSVAWDYIEEEFQNPQTAYEVELADSEEGPAIASTQATGEAKSAAIPEPPGGWVNGETYYVRVRAACSPSDETPYLFSEWTEWQAYTLSRPQPITDVSVSTTSSGWFEEQDSNGDLVADSGNDTVDEGRGSVALSWPRVQGATSYGIYLHDGNEFRLVDTVEDEAWTSAGKELFPTDSAIDAMSQDSTANPYASGTRDLRDDPNALYRKMATGALVDRHDYLLKVVPDDAITGASEMSECTTVSVVLPNRTRRVNEDPRHTEHDLGTILQHDVSATLDQGALQLDVTDIEIASWGPEAALARHYSSDAEADATFASGWRFNFEQSVVSSGSVALYTDESGETHRFRWDTATSAWVAPSGFDATLEQTSTFTLTRRDGTKLIFDSTGALGAEQDRSGNITAYEPESEDLRITAANGQSILVDRDVTGRVMSAAYETAAGTREVAYSSGTTPTVTYDYGALDPMNRTFSYGYTSSQLSSLSLADWPETGQSAALGFVYDSGQVSGVRLPGYEQDSDARAEIEYESDAATITRYGRVDGSEDDVAISQVYTWNGNGTCATRELPHTSSEQGETWRFEYSPSNLVIAETSPLDATTRRVVDIEGDVILEADELGHEMAYVHNAFGQVTSETDARGNTLIREYDDAGNLVSESGRGSSKSWAHDSVGRVTDEHGGSCEEKHFSDFASNGEPQETSYGLVQRDWDDPILSSSDELVETQEIDEFGNVTAKRLPDLVFGFEEAIETTGGVFSVSGLCLSTANGEGTVEKQLFDKLGNVVESWRTDSGGTRKVDWVRRTYDDMGNVVEEERLDSDGEVGFSTAYSYDALGRQITSSHSGQGSSHRHYDARGNVVAEWAVGADVDEALESTRYSYDLADRAVSEVAAGNAANDAKTTTYFANGLERRITEPGGSWTERSYDECGNTLTETSPGGDGDEVTRYVYDAAGRVVSETSPAGFVTTHTYDDFGREIATNQTTRTYNSMGWVLVESAEDGTAKRYVYWPSGRAASMAEPTQTSVTTYEYDGAGAVVETVLPNGNVTHTNYDDFGRPAIEWQKTDAGASTYLKDLRFEFDDFGRSVCTTDAVSGLVTRTSYHAGSEQPASQQLIYPGATTQLVTDFDALGRETSRELTYSQGSSTRQIDSRDAADRETAWGIDALADSSISYDSDGRVTSHSGPGRAASTGYVYDGTSGKKTSEGHKLSYTTSKSIPTSWTAGYSYDEGGKLSRATIGEQTESYSYDEAGNLTGILSWTGDTTMLSYADTNQLQSKTTTATRGDNFNRANGPLGSDWSVLAGTCSISNNMFYPSINGSIAKYVPAGDSVGDAVVTAGVGNIYRWLCWGIKRRWGAYDYYRARIIFTTGLNQAVVIERVSGATVTELARKDTEGRTGGQLVIFISGDTATASYSDSPFWGSMTATMPGYSGGAVGLGGQATGSIDNFAVSGGDTASSASYTYDETTGSRIAQGPASDPDETTYAYDESRRLVGYTSAGVDADFVYDANGQRTRAVVVEGSTTTTMTYHYTGLQLLSLVSAKTQSGSTTTESVSFAHDGRGRPYAGVYRNETAQTAKLFYPVTTNRGDVVELLDSNGAAFAFYNYDVWGNSTKTASKATPTGQITAEQAVSLSTLQPLRFAGYAYDSFSGLYYCSQRYYDPATYQFITKDPALADGEESAYQYCGGDAVGAVDPSGLWTQTRHKTMTRAIAKSLGYSDSMADKFADGAHDLDNVGNDAFTHSWWHFNEYHHDDTVDTAIYALDVPDSRRDFLKKKLAKAQEQWDAGEKKKAARTLGLGLHSLQDAYAHGSISRTEHMTCRKCECHDIRVPDCPNFKSWRLDKAKSSTKTWMRKIDD